MIWQVRSLSCHPNINLTQAIALHLTVYSSMTAHLLFKSSTLDIISITANWKAVNLGQIHLWKMEEVIIMLLYR